MNSTLLPHQMDELAFLLGTPRALLLSETGTGKTPVMVSYADEALKRGERVVWLTAKGLVHQATQEARRWLSPDSPQPVFLSKAVSKAKPDDRFVIMTHKIAAKTDPAEFGPIDLLIVDEASVVGGGGVNPEGSTYCGIRDLAKAAARSVFATATPVSTAHARCLWALLEAAQIPGRPSWDELHGFTKWGTAPTKWGSVPVAEGITDEGLERLIQAMAPYSIRTTVEETGQPMPTIERHYINVPLVASARVAYNKASQVSGLAGHHERQQASRSAASLIPRAVAHITASIASGRHKVIAFSENLDIFEPLVAALQNAGIHVEEVTGDDSGPRRAKAIERHKAAPAAVLAVTGAGEHGLNLQHSSELVSVVATWVPSREDQREGRLKRIGSPFDVVHHTVIRPQASIETRKQVKHDDKRDVAARVMAAVPSAAGHSKGAA